MTHIQVREFSDAMKLKPMFTILAHLHIIVNIRELIEVFTNSMRNNR